jgi:S1-C subfamily serine protease
VDDVMKDMDLETVLKDALKDIESFRTPDCLDVPVIGQYAEKKLDSAQSAKVEEHLHTCLYCLKQLNDMTEMLHYEKHPEPLSPQLRQRLQEVIHLKPASQRPSFWEKLKELLSFSPLIWRYSAIGLATAWMLFLVNTYVIRPPEHHAGIPDFSRDAFVKVQALNDAGTVLREQQGVVVGSEGLIASNLTSLAGAGRIRITLKDGTTREISKIWKDDDKNLAVMKTDAHSLTAIPLGDITEIVGKRIYAVADPSHPSTGIHEAVASDIKELSSRRKEGGARYLQVATQTTTATKGAVIDDHGRLLGFLITEEKHINLATPASAVEELVKNGTPIPINELNQISFSGDAFNAYMKGILAREGQRWDEAITCFNKAIELNKRHEGAYIELGYAYYRKNDFEKEYAAYQKALEINENNVDALYSLGTNMESRGKYSEALPYYEKALLLDPKDKELLYQLGISYLAQGKKDKAMDMANRLKQYDRGQAELLRRLIELR